MDKVARTIKGLIIKLKTEKIVLKDSYKEHLFRKNPLTRQTALSGQTGISILQPQHAKGRRNMKIRGF